MNKEPPLVSIGMPVRNGENYLSEALDSLLRQSIKNIEIIISDNASNDDTEKIVKNYCSLDARIKYFKQLSNLGATENYEFVLRKATGKFFMWAAHDDIWDSNWIETLINNIKENDIGVRGSIRFLVEGRKIIRHLKNYSRGNQLRMFLENETNYRCHYIYSLFWRSKLLHIDRSALKLDYSPDNLFIFSLIRHGDLRTTDKTLMTFRVHSNNLGAEYSKPWKGLRKIVYRIHPIRYYAYHLLYIDTTLKKLAFISLTPLKHIYAQTTFWIRGIQELILRRHII